MMNDVITIPLVEVNQAIKLGLVEKANGIRQKDGQKDRQTDRKISLL